MHRQIPQVEVNVQADRMKITQTDASSRGQCSDRWGDKYIDKTDGSMRDKYSYGWGDKFKDRCFK
jgi:hypothetical protein